MDGLQAIESWDECKSAVASLYNAERVAPWLVSIVQLLLHPVQMFLP
jgi:hypothetical protein